MYHIHCTHDRHALEILDILNEVIVTSTALYDYQPRTRESMVSWFKTKEAGSYPIVGAIDDSNQLMGFASYGAFRGWPAYKYTVEHSVYIHKVHRGKGLGIALMQRLIEEAKSQRYHVMIGGVDATNSTSISLHEKLGFFHAGTIKHAGFKFNRWLDLSFYQLILDTPAEPVDG